MPLTNRLQKQVDQPVFEWLRFAPTTTTSNSSLGGQQDNLGRYFYYQVSTALWRYDTYSDSWQELAPLASPTYGTALKHASNLGYRGHTIAATSSTITIPGFGRYSKNPVGLKIRIIAGLGAGQERTITSVADSVVADFGVPTTGGANTLTDTTKKWQVNQWDGYQCRVNYGIGTVQVRKILYNSTTALTFTDANFQAIDSFNNTGFSSTPPYSTPASSGSTTTTHYQIESSVLTIDTPWTVIPDQSSVYMVMSGGIWYYPGGSNSTLLYYYDILTDSVMNKTAMGNVLAFGLNNFNGYDAIIERIGEVGGTYGGFTGAFTGGTAASGITMALTAGLTYETDRWANHEIRISNGTGVGQKRRIVGNNGYTFWINKKWDVTPDSTSGFLVYADTNKLWAIDTNSRTTGLVAYNIEEDFWSSGHISDSGVVRNISVTPFSGITAGSTAYGPPHEGFGVASITRTTTGILSGVVNAAGSNYVVGDLVTCSTTGTNGQFYVTGVNSTGGVTSLELAASGSGYTAGSSSTTGGSGTSLTITLTVGTTALVGTVSNHDFRGPSGGVAVEYVTIGGCTTDTTFNATFGIIGVGSLNTFSIAAPSSSASPTAASSSSTSLIVDASKNWATNEHVGKLLFTFAAGTSPTYSSQKISANTATTISFSSGTISSPTNGTTRYYIQEPRAFGAVVTNKIANRAPFGWATSGTATTLVDTSKNWLNNQWINCRVRVIAGTGVGNESVITGNTSTTLTVASWGVATPDATSKYEILDSYGIVTTGGSVASTITDANKNWTTNILSGKTIRIIAGTGIGTEATVTSNTATVITANSTFTTDTTSVYAIFDAPARGQGAKLVWLYGLSDSNKRGRWLFSPRGAASIGHDIYDIPSNTWESGTFITPQSTSFTLGTMGAYDGGDYYYLIKDATNRVYQFNFANMTIAPATSIPYAQSTAIVGNRMEIVTTADGLKYLYIMRHTGQEMWRTLLFW